MAKQLSNSGIASGSIIRPWHVTQSVDAFTGTEAYDITISGSLTLTGSFSIDNITASLFGTASWANNVVSASYAVTSSYSNTSTSASYSDTSVTSSYITGSGVDGPFGSNSVVSSSYSVSSSQAISSSYAVSSSYVVSSSYADTSLTSSFVTGSDVYGPFGSNSIISASYAVTASFASTVDTSVPLTTTGIQNPPGGGGGGGNPFNITTQDAQPINLNTSNLRRFQVDESGSVNLGDGGNGTLSTILNNSITTLNSESVTLLTVPTSDGVAYTVKSYVVGYGGADRVIGGEIIGAFQNTSGILYSGGSPVSSSISSLAGTPSFSLTGSGTNIILEVTGNGVGTINWAGNLKYITFDSTF